jgi:CMP-N-acetylneuraminic acid synthetase
MKTYAFIFARGTSQGVCGKNTRDLAGKPLLAHSIDLAREIDVIDKIYVSTEDQDIAHIAIERGAEVIDRPAELADHHSQEWSAWQHAVKWLKDRGQSFDVFLSLPTTSPLRKRQDILAALKRLDINTDIVLTMTPATRSPWFNMVKKTEDGLIRLVIDNAPLVTRRQDAPIAFNLTTVAYVTRPEFIMSNEGVLQGRVAGIEIPEERALDIDSEYDLRIANLLMRAN